MKKKILGLKRRLRFPRHPGAIVKNVIAAAFVVFLVATGIILIWVATLRIPDLQSFQDKILLGSTKIYDRTGEILLYDLNKDVKQQVVPFDQISPHLKKATLAIEDAQFYQHSGVRPTAFIRAVLVNALSGSFKQGGSTITQQVIKNALLTTDKKISRKIKEWVLALKLERIMSKDEILGLYLNGSPYGGTLYGVEEASLAYFGKRAADLNLAESAYMAAIPKAPSYYSPFGNHRKELEIRKNLVLQQMRINDFITEEEYQAAKNETIEFKRQENTGIKAPHFVMFVRDYLIEKYGEDMVNNGGLKVITTLDYPLQQQAEEIVKKYALTNTENFNASNGTMVAIDPKTGQTLVMVGSRDYFDKKIDGNFNVAIAHRQPGSAFKPIAYVTAFEKGFTPDTVLFDLPTQFSTNCDAYGTPLSPNITKDSCYMPQNYDHQFRGPMSLRNALAQSINIPAIKILYLAGLTNTLQTARDMGITSLTDINRYGLTMVLGGGEVSPLQLTSAYGVFAANGIKYPNTSVLKVTDKDGEVLEEFQSNPIQVIDEQSVLQLNDILHDNQARLALNGPGSATDFPNNEVALKTGTTNDSRDAWIIGYTPSIVVGAWAGNNDNSPMIKKTSGMIVAPMWREFMNRVLASSSPETFKRPEPIDPTLKPSLRGIWQGSEIYTIDKTSGKLATDFTPVELREERAIPNVHSILYWVNKNDPKGPPPANPSSDPQFILWETPIQDWLKTAGEIGPANPPHQTDDVHTPDRAPRIEIRSPDANSVHNSREKVRVSFSTRSSFDIEKAEFYVNGRLIGTETDSPFSFSFVPRDIEGIRELNDLKVVVYDEVQNKGEASVSFLIE